MFIELSKLQKIVQDGYEKRSLLTDIVASLEPNTNIALVGVSGSGKTALLRILGCLDSITSGSYLLNGQQIMGLSESGLASVRRKYISFIGFEPEFIENTTVYEALEMVLLSGTKKDKHKQILDILEFIGLISKLNTPISSLRHYERMYISAARAFIKTPQLVVADDPFHTMHTTESQMFLNLLTSLREQYGGALVYSTYDPTLLKQAQQIIYMKNGKIVKTEKQ